MSSRSQHYRTSITIKGSQSFWLKMSNHFDKTHSYIWIFQAKQILIFVAEFNISYYFEPETTTWYKSNVIADVFSSHRKLRNANGTFTGVLQCPDRLLRIRRICPVPLRERTSTETSSKPLTSVTTNAVDTTANINTNFLKHSIFSLQSAFLS